MPIRRIFCHPPLCVARLGGSSTPMDAYTWIPAVDPHRPGETRVEPAWTLDVEADGSVSPRLPSEVVLRDGDALRPVAPFVEVWAELDDDRQVPLTPQLLQAEGLNEANLRFTCEAMNAKAARRTGRPDLRFGTFPAVTVRGDDHGRHDLPGTSPPSALRPMIPRGRSIPLGAVRVIRPGIQPASGTTPWADSVRVDTIRVRYTPAAGTFFAPTALQNLGVNRDGQFYLAAPVANAFLADDAGWFGAPFTGRVNPADTYAGAELVANGRRSLGMVDDTCELQLRVELIRSTLGLAPLEARANVLAGPPDYAPDRRPFLSIADALNDRAADREKRNTALTGDALERWVEDLFERAYEVVSLTNVDQWRARLAAELLPGDRLPAAIPGDATPLADRALGGLDALRDENIAIPAPSDEIPLPLHQRARERHRALSDVVALRRFVQEKPARLAQLLRRPFRRQANEDSGPTTTMQMPPFMRGSNANPLTLARWQYELVLKWVGEVMAPPPSPLSGFVAAAGPADAGLSAAALARRAEVLARLDAAP